MHRRPMFFGTLRWKPQQEMAATFLATFLDLRGRNCGLFIHLGRLGDGGKPEKKQAGLLWHVSGWAWQARGTRTHMQKTITKSIQNMQKWYQNRLKSYIWAPPGRHRGFTREKKPFRRISGACFGPFWLHFGLPWGPPGRALGGHGGAKTRPEAEKGVFRRGLRKTLEKRSSLEGPKPEN